MIRVNQSSWLESTAIFAVQSGHFLVLGGTDQTDSFIAVPVSFRASAPTSLSSTAAAESAASFGGLLQDYYLALLTATATTESVTG
jgi:hypothetical protein